MSDLPADAEQSPHASVVKAGYVKRFKKGFLSKGFKYVFVELYSDSHFIWYRDQCSSKPDGVVFLKDVCNFLAVGPYTQSIPTRPNLPRGSSERHILAVPVHPSQNTYVHWFMFCNDADLNDWMVRINNTLPPLPPPANPPGDEQIPNEPPPPYSGQDDLRKLKETKSDSNRDINSAVTNAEPLAMAMAAGPSLWGWTWGWGGGWGCDGWGCFDYGPTNGGGNSGGTAYQHYDNCHQQHFENNTSGYDYNSYENGGTGYEYGEGGVDVTLDAGVDTSAFDCVFDIGF